MFFSNFVNSGVADKFAEKFERKAERAQMESLPEDLSKDIVFFSESPDGYCLYLQMSSSQPISSY